MYAHIVVLTAISTPNVNPSQQIIFLNKEAIPQVYELPITS